MVRTYAIARFLFLWFVLVEATVTGNFIAAKEHLIEPADTPQDILDRAVAGDRLVFLLEHS